MRNKEREEARGLARWFVRGRWPQAYVVAHGFAIASFALLFVTGVLLLLPGVHTALIPYLSAVYAFHVSLGVLFGLSLLFPVLLRLPSGKRVRRLEWIFAELMIAALSVSGVALWQIALFPAGVRAAAFSLHRDAAYVMAVWIFIHGVMRLSSVHTRDVAGLMQRRVHWERRDFLRWTGIGIAASTAAAWGGGAVFFGKRAASGRTARGAGTPAGVPAFAEYYTVTGSFPDISARDYTLSVDGLVRTPLRLNLVELERIGLVAATHSFQCVTGWVVPNVVWTGVPLSVLVKAAGVRPGARYLVFHSADGVYTDSLSLEQAVSGGALLALRIDGQPLPVKQGYPVRLIVPNMYGYKSVKWVDRVTLAASRELGYWESRGYPSDAYIRGET